jgi:putative NADH-flavin reductase
MKVLVIGGSRGIGSKVAQEALAKGHKVTVFSRKPKALNLEHPNLYLRAGNVLDSASLQKVVKNHEAVICALGLPTLKAIGLPFLKRSYVLSRGTQNILAAMEANNIQRFICVTAIGTGESIKKCTPVNRLVLTYGLRWLFKEKNRQEQLIKNSNLKKWTIIRPTALTNGRKKGCLKNGIKKYGILTQISRADVASAIVGMLDGKNSNQKALILSYSPKIGDSARWLAGYVGKG